MIPATHKQFADNAVSRFKFDPRVLGVAMGGSWLTGKMDEFSDLDFVIVVDSAKYDEVVSEMHEIAGSIGNCLGSFSAEHVGHPNMAICLFDEPLLHVDLKFITLNDLEDRIENPEVLWEREGALTKVIEKHHPDHPQLDLQWIEDRFWTWIHYGAQRLGRGEIFEVLSTLAFLRERVLGPMESARAGKPPRGVRRMEQMGDAADLREMRDTIASYDAKSCERALKASAKMYVGLRELLDKGLLKRNHRVEMASLRYLHQIGEKLR